MSVDNATATRFEAKRLLEQQGTAVIVENADGAAVLRCRADEREAFSRSSSRTR